MIERFHPLHVVTHPQNPVPIPRERAGEIVFKIFLDGMYNPMIKHPMKFVGRSTKRAV